MKKMQLRETFIYFFILVGCTTSSDSSRKLFDVISSTPVLLGPGTISTSEFHEAVNYLDENNDALYFTRSDQQFDSSNIYVSYPKDGSWQSPLKLPFSNSGYDAGFSLSPNRDFGFFISKRSPGISGLSEKWNIWKVRSDQNGNWSEPEVLAAPLNSKGLECCMTMNKQGQAFFSSNRAGSWDIYEAQFRDGQFHNIKPVQGLINTEAGEWPAYVNEAGDFMLLSSIRDTGLGGDDIYVSRKSGDEWTEPILMDSTINSSSYEDSPMLTQDGKILLFSSWRDSEISKGRSNIYSVPFMVDE